MVMKKSDYLSPQIEVVEIEAEQCFANSTQDMIYREEDWE